MSDIRDFHPGVEGGVWNWRTRLACWLIGHSFPPQPSTDIRDVHVYFCRRCNGFAGFVDPATGHFFRTFDEWFAFRNPDVKPWEPLPHV